MATQLLATLGVAFFIGYKVDKHFHFKFPITMLTLPLLFLVASLWKIVKDTSNRH
ncbi:MAG: AtpZ/AtpI family protein [Bacteroidetes bacterium]|nr:AtpZ/AtpI family protein [Bacteroidota bacterium]MBK8145912.1 AtpZ/AtpI family protein [Bacteroidota bacterium]MBP6314737.1 AtpZ/AtpI family protein [Chitinophagaceae bacterium]